MGLNDLVEKEERQAKVDHGDQTDFDENDLWDDGDEHDDEETPHRKPCPQCGYRGARHVSETEGGNRDRFWKCANEDCAITTYLLGWNEWKDDSDFLSNYDYHGWRYTSGEGDVKSGKE